MYAKNASVRLTFAVAAALSTVVVIGSVLALADHYGEALQVAMERPVSVAQR